MDATYQEVIKVVIIVVVGLFGAPVTQLAKNLLSSLFKKPVEDRAAVALTGVMAALLALLTLFLQGTITGADFSVDKFPQTFFTVFTLASIYFAWFKNTPSKLGRGLLLKG